MAKAQLPEVIRVCGKDYAVQGIERNALGSDRTGECVHHNLTIIYDTAWAASQQRDTILHEVIHACDYTTRLGLDEPQVHALAGLLYGVLADNPEFARWLIAEIK